MPLNAQTSPWWSTFLNTHGKDGEEEKAFLGYLVTKEIDPGSEPDVLEAAYTDFKAWMDASYAGTTAAAAPQAVEAPPPPAVPRSSHANPMLQKPMDAATRPPELREDAGMPRGGTAPPAPPPAGDVPGSMPQTGETPQQQHEREEAAQREEADHRRRR